MKGNQTQTKSLEPGVCDENGTEWTSVQLGNFATAKGGFGFPTNRQGRKGRYPFFKVSDMNLPSNRKRMIEANNWVDEDD